MIAESERVLIGRGRAAELFAWGDHQALKLFYPGWPLAGAEAEAHAAQRVYESGLRVPAVEGTIEVDGRPGIIYERVDGAAMLDSLATRPWAVIHYARLLAGLHADMHAHRAEEFPSQREYMLKQIRSAPSLPDQKRQAVLKLLEKLPDGDALCHGDYHPGNVLLAKDGPSIIDWPLAARGNPVADVARTSLLLTLGAMQSDTPGRWLMEIGRNLFHHFYLERYVHLRGISPQQVAAWRVPVAAARLAEGLEEETDDLLTVITAGLPEVT
jgi:aminoglycoside phosphotransferase (APT) family kinase protein